MVKWLFSHLPPLSDADLKKRISGIQFINYLADRFSLQCSVSGRASVLFHRYFTINKLQQDVAAASLLVASKLSDCIVNIASLAERLSKATVSTNDSSSHGMQDLKVDWTESLYYHEELLLAETCFDLDIPDAFEPLKALHSKLDSIDDEIKKYSWVVLHDSDVCVRYHAEDIAAAALLYAYESHNMRPEKAFWSLVYKKEIIREIRKHIEDLYKYTGLIDVKS